MPNYPASTNLYPGMQKRPNGRPYDGTEPMPGSARMFAETVEENPAVKSDGFTCSVCGKTLKTKLALAGHSRSHK